MGLSPRSPFLPSSNFICTARAHSTFDNCSCADNDDDADNVDDDDADADADADAEVAIMMKSRPPPSSSSPEPVQAAVRSASQPNSVAQVLSISNRSLKV